MSSASIRRGIPARRLVRSDFNRPTLQVARDLLGKRIVRRINGRIVSALIAETEAYRGPADRAAHSYGGRRTPRVEPLYADGGTVYVYFIYGMHWMLNFSTAGPERPEGVLIRAVVTQAEPRPRLLSGPGRVTRYLRIDRNLDGVDATCCDQLWLEDDGMRIRPGAVQRGPRVGIDYAGALWAAKPWRFVLNPDTAFDLMARSQDLSR